MVVGSHMCDRRTGRRLSDPHESSNTTSPGYVRHIAYHRQDEHPGMHAGTVRVSAKHGGFGPFHRAMIDRSDVSIVALHELRLLADGTTVMLYEYRGSREAAEQIARTDLDADETVWKTARVGDRELMYAHAEPGDLLRVTLELLERHPVVVDWPIRFATDGTAIVTLIGRTEAIREAMSIDVGEIDLRVERIGEYTSDAAALAPDLTGRELHAMRTAVELGHYENPREATYADIAEELDLSTGTVGHHLRNAEAKLMQYMFG